MMHPTIYTVAALLPFGTRAISTKMTTIIMQPKSGPTATCDALKEHQTECGGGEGSAMPPLGTRKLHKNPLMRSDTFVDNDH